MGFFTFLSGKSPLDIEVKGDEFFEVGEYGAAKLEYEKALDKIERRLEGEPEHIHRLREKLVRSKEALAGRHKEIAYNLIESGRLEEAEDLLQLALELTKTREFTYEIEKLLEAIRNRMSREEGRIDRNSRIEDYEEDSPDIPSEEEEVFAALCGSLPEEEQAAYWSYGEAFQRGYVALNQGDFDLAARELSKALEENPEEGDYILLELANAQWNLGRQDEADDLLEEFLGKHPESLKAYSILCEILWERKAFDQALERLNSVPREGVDPVAHVLLWGETLLQAERYQEAENLFHGFMQSYGWKEVVGRSLARVYEAAGQKEKARSLYLEIMQNCQSCRRPTDPLIKRRLADLDFESGNHSVITLELYLALSQEDPANRKDYYLKISRIYVSLGNEREARRFRTFAEELEEGDTSGMVTWY